MKNEDRSHPDVNVNLNVRGLLKPPTLAVNERCRGPRGIERSDEDILVGPGSKELMFILFHSRRILRALGGAVAARLRGAGIFAPMPEGGFCVFPDFGSRARILGDRGITTSADLCEGALEDTGVAFLPDEAFGRERRAGSGTSA